MNGRKDFLTAFFRSLDAKKIRWCVLRNYEGLMDDSAATDLDLLVEEKDVAIFNEVLQSAARESGQRFVHYARYVNHSCVFWSEQSRFTRIDFDMEIRWRLFPTLTADEILKERQKREEFYVPHPKHEAVVVFVQAIWMGKLDQRYREQLARLYVACGDKEELRNTCRQAFSNIAGELMDFHADVLRQEFTAAFCGRLKRSIITKTLTRPTEWPFFAKYALADAKRFWQRLKQPPGLSLLCVSSNAQEIDLEGVIREMKFLFPAQKSQVHRMDFSKSTEPRIRRGLGLALKRLRTLFKGGLFVESYRLSEGVDFKKILRANPPRFYASRCFIFIEDSKGRACLEHVGSGLRRESVEGQRGAASLCALLVDLISVVLERENAGKLWW